MTAIYIYIYIYIYRVSQKWVHPSHFCRYLSISLHGTTLTKWHFDTMKSSLYAAYITELIHLPLKITQNITINIHHVNCQYFVWPPSLSRTAFTLLDIEFARASQVATGMLFNSSSRSWQIFETLHTSTFRLGIPQRCSIGFKSGDMLGQSITFTLSLFSKAMVVLEVCLGSLSCWNTALLPSFWREGIMLCCSISQYMLEFIFSLNEI